MKESPWRSLGYARMTRLRLGQLEISVTPTEMEEPPWRSLGYARDDSATLRDD